MSTPRVNEAADESILPPVPPQADHEWAGDNEGHNCATCIEQGDHFQKCDRPAHVIAGVEADGEKMVRHRHHENLRRYGSIAGPGIVWPPTGQDR